MPVSRVTIQEDYIFDHIYIYIYGQGLPKNDGVVEQHAATLISSDEGRAAMEVHLAVASAAVAIGWTLRGGPATFQTSSVPVPGPCHCHCDCSCTESRDSSFFYLLLIIGLVLLIGLLIFGFLLHSHSKNLKPTVGSPKGGKGVQGVSSRFLQITQ